MHTESQPHNEHHTSAPTDRIDVPADVWTQSTAGTTHALIAFASFACIVLGMFVLTWTFSRGVRMHSIARRSGLLFGAGLALMFTQQQGPWVGLLQRMFLTVVGVWVILVAWQCTTTASLGRGARRTGRMDDPNL